MNFSQPDYAFAFDNRNYFDGVLTIEVLSDLVEEGCTVDDSTDLKTNDEGSSSAVYLAPKRKRSREEINTRANDADDKREEENHPLRVRTMHINSSILAVKSQFFYKLFLNDVEVLDQWHVTVKILESEEAAFMDLLKFMYCNTLSTTTTIGLLDVLMVADKFEVKSCMRYCSNVLKTLHMTIESASLYVDLPFKISMVDAVQPLTDAAKLFLVLRFMDITKKQEEALSLPLSGIKVVLSSGSLQSASEDDVYDFALKWARKHYPNSKERRKVWTSHLCYLIRFPFMTCTKLKKIMTSNDFGRKLASKLVFEALFYKTEEPYRQRLIAATVGNALRHRYAERAYKYRPVKVVEFETPLQQCIVYLDLKRIECGILFPDGKVFSQGFHLAGREFFLSAHCNMDEEGEFRCLGLFLGIQEEAEPVTIVYDFSVRMSPSDEYVSKYMGTDMLTSGVDVGCTNLCSVAWTPFLNIDSVYFIDGFLHIRAEITINEVE